MTLLERFDNGDFDRWTDEAAATVRRALAIAQAVEERMQNHDYRVRVAAETILDRADKLLEGK